jgi:isoleucyl-tRNA synthetase
MTFKEVPSQVSFPRLEEEVLAFWKEHDTFRRSLELRQDAPRYVFYEGPPTANGLPGTHHVLARVFKDLFPRYKTMQGAYVLRKGGWDTHGLPVELEVEKELGFSGKQAIEEYGIAEFNQKCKESVFRYVKEWEQLTERIAFWIDMDDPYITLKNSYIESLWWILRQYWDRELLYQGYKVVPYCPSCGTPLSDHEVALGYEQTEDPSIYVRFPIVDQPGTYFLVWTTTPWTLPGNVGLAVGEDVTYVTVEQTYNGTTERLILAEALLDQALSGDYKIVARQKGKELRGMQYNPLYTFLPFTKRAHYVVTGDFVSTEDGTGIVHIAPAFGAEDLEVGLEYDMPVLVTVDERGRFIDSVKPWRGLFVKEADSQIIKELQERGLMYRVSTYIHTYPFCWRCSTPLLYYVRTTWFIETSRFKDRLVANNEVINWYPDYIKEGRFGNWLANNVDWALGRERYWGTPLPVWVCQSCGYQHCIGSLAELSSLSGQDLSNLDLHRPYVDEITFNCQKCGGEMRRVPEVLDCWFDSGAMPVAQWHYPFENQEIFEEQFPADYICEAVDQTRGWFYSLHAISTLLFDEPCFLNCICLGLILDHEGYKMSKSRGNVVNPWDVINAHGADALRWYLYTAAPPGADRRFSSELVGEVLRKFSLTLWNTYSFFVTYANIDGWVPSPAPACTRPVPEAQRRVSAAEGEGVAQAQAAREVSLNSLDRWLLAELNLLVDQVTRALDEYDVTGAARPIARFVDDLSNWYVRRSRRRFWKSESDADKAAAYQTLYTCLTTLAGLLAPFTPFLAETLYQNLVRSVDAQAPESVHLSRFPVADKALVDDRLVQDMRLVMRLVSLGHAARNSAGIKLRQPLASAHFLVRSDEEANAFRRLADIVRDEMNAKTVMAYSGVPFDYVDYVINPLPARLGPKYGADFPRVRAAVAALDPVEAAARITAGQTVSVVVDGRTLELLPDELEVQLKAKEGYAVAEEAGYIVAVDIEIDEELRREGLARDIVRRIQTMRKDADFRVEETIVTYYQAVGELAEVFQAWGEYIKGETLSTDLVMAEPPGEAYTRTFDIEGHSITLGVMRRARG